MKTNFLMLIVISIMYSNCGNSSKELKIDKTLLGTWEAFVKYKIEEKDTLRMFKKEEDDGIYLTFSEDGSFERIELSNEKKPKAEGKWGVINNTIKVEINGQKKNFDYYMDKDTLKVIVTIDKKGATHGIGFLRKN